MRVKSHNLCEKAPWLVIAIWMVLSFFATQIAMLIAGIVTNIAGKQGNGAMANVAVQDSIGSFILVAVTLAILFINWRMFSPEYEGPFKSHVGIGQILFWGSPLILYLVTSQIRNIITSDFYFNPTVNAFSRALAAAVVEETIYRAIPIAIGMGFMKTEKRPYILTIVTAVIFGLIHMMNLLGGGSVGMTVLQVTYAAVFGLFYAGLFLRTGTVLPCIILHFLTDYVAYVFYPDIQDGVLDMSFNLTENLFEIIWVVITLVFTLFVIFGPRRKDIIPVWNKKWNKEQP